jgi:GNAT superfamily N-acetyltransferase
MRRVNVRLLSAPEVETLLPSLVDVLWDAVDGGGSLGFLAPLADADAKRYWRSLVPEIERGSRFLFVAFVGARLVGSVQLVLSPWVNSPHRAEVQKLFVATSLKGKGIGKALMAAVHDTARERGRSLLLLNTRVGNPAEHFYRAHGYRVAGVIPGYTLGADGERHDNLTMYRQS